MSPDQGQSGASFEETPRIIVMDDEESIRLGCEKVLTREGFEVVVAADGSSGWEMLQEDEFDLALIDLKMPGIDGMNILKLMGENLPDVVAIVITGYASYETAVETVKLGAYDYIPKPFTPDELRNVVRRGLERRFLRLSNRRLREERERFLLDLTEERSRLMTILRAMSDAVLVANRRGELVLANPAGLEWINDGEDPDPSDVPEISGSVTHEEIAGLVERIENDPDLEGCDAEIETEDDRYFHAAATAVRDDEGGYLGVVIVLRDISERREIEKMKSAFVRMVSHELRSPLAAVQGYLELLVGGDVDGEDADRMLRRCNSRVEALQQMINDLLDLSRIESGTVQRELRPCDLGEILDEIVQLQRGAGIERGIEISLDVRGECHVVADAREVEEVFTNLISNAVKYNRDGGKVEVVAERHDDKVSISVSDTGIGMKEEAVENIFEEFFRVRNSETASVTGTGLGLAIVKRLVDSYDGDIQVESVPGEGSTFTVTLPARPE